MGPKISTVDLECHRSRFHTVRFLFMANAGHMTDSELVAVK